MWEIDHISRFKPDSTLYINNDNTTSVNQCVSCVNRVKHNIGYSPSMMMRLVTVIVALAFVTVTYAV